MEDGASTVLHFHTRYHPNELGTLAEQLLAATGGTVRPVATAIGTGSTAARTTVGTIAPTVIGTRA